MLEILAITPFDENIIYAIDSAEITLREKMKKNKIGIISIFLIIIITSFFSIKMLSDKYKFVIPRIFESILPQDTNKIELPNASTRFETKLFAKLNELEIKKEEVTIIPHGNNAMKEYKVRIPRGRPFEWTLWQLFQCTRNTSYSVADCIFYQENNNYVLTIISKKKPKIILNLSHSPRYLSYSSKFAFLIEDFNFEANEATMNLLSFPEPLTISLLPSNQKSAWTAQAARQYNKEVIIYLPFETDYQNSFSSPSTIMIHYPEEKIKKIIHDAVKTIPHYSGFSNFNSSRALADSRVMHIVIKEIKKNKGYFINTSLNEMNVIPEIIKKVDIPYGKVSKVIQTDSQSSTIEEQLKHCINNPRKKNNTIILVKSGNSFIQDLKRTVPLFKQSGIRLVYVSEIVRKQK